jgi:hypothetical protein
LSAAETTLARPADRHLRQPRPSFPGAVRGELLKASRQLTTWVMLGGALLLFCVFGLALLSTDQVRTQLHQDPLAWFYTLLDILLTLFDTGSGIFLLVVSHAWSEWSTAGAPCAYCSPAEPAACSFWPRS